MQDLGTRTRENGRSGDLKIVTQPRTIAESMTLLRFAALGVVKFAAGAITPNVGNTGDGVMSAFALAAGGPPKIGDYSAVCVAAAANAGTFNVFDPDGVLIGVATVAVTFAGGGVTFLIGDGAADFIVGDSFLMAMGAGSGQAKLLDNTATDGTQLLDSILSEDVTTGVGVTQVTTVYETGEFNEGEITFENGTVAEYKAAARDLGIFFKAAVPQ